MVLCEYVPLLGDYFLGKVRGALSGTKRTDVVFENHLAEFTHSRKVPVG